MADLPFGRVTASSGGHCMNEIGTDAGAQIELKLRDVHQLFHSLDPSPFREKDLDKDAEEFIVAWAKELSGTDNLSLKIHLQISLPDGMNEGAIGEAVRNYFNYQAGRFAHRNRELLREGWKNLGIGISFLASCLIIAQYLLRFGDGTLIAILRESLIIGGWVAMWRPMQIFLYDRWPLKRMQKLYRRLGTMQVCMIEPVARLADLP